jgi:predicted cupin superfamily sugar epimerase
MNANELIRLLDLSPLAGEGGYFRRTHEGSLDAQGRASYSVIYYLLTREQPRSKLHHLPFAECYHFYLGDPVQTLILPPKGPGQEIVLGQNLPRGQQVQVQVPANSWHGSMLVAGGQFALLGTSMTPGYEDQDYTDANGQELSDKFPKFAVQIRQLTEDIL